MKIEQVNPDAAIDRVLNGLASVEAPHEIEQRVLRVLQRRAAQQKIPKFAPLAILAHWQPWAVAACVVALSFAASVAIRKRHEPRREEAVLKSHTSSAVSPASQIAAVQRENRQRQVIASGSRHKDDLALPKAIDDMDALAISEMNAPSKPAPPLPLTHQEKLLAEAAHQGNSTDLSSLRPEVRAKQMELSKAEFHDFFEPPPTKENE